MTVAAFVIELPSTVIAALVDRRDDVPVGVRWVRPASLYLWLTTFDAPSEDALEAARLVGARAAERASPFDVRLLQTRLEDDVVSCELQDTEGHLARLVSDLEVQLTDYGFAVDEGSARLPLGRLQTRLRDGADGVRQTDSGRVLTVSVPCFGLLAGAPPSIRHRCGLQVPTGGRQGLTDEQQRAELDVELSRRLDGRPRSRLPVVLTSPRQKRKRIFEPELETLDDDAAEDGPVESATEE